ncbi:MAG: hypothetical protein AB1671_22030 [Thermodesulfobacteriota bacterium]
MSSHAGIYPAGFIGLCLLAPVSCRERSVRKQTANIHVRGMAV